MTDTAEGMFRRALASADMSAETAAEYGMTLTLEDDGTYSVQVHRAIQNNREHEDERAAFGADSPAAP